MSLRANVASSLRFTGVARAEADERAMEMLRLVDLVGLSDRRPNEVSGGQRQRAGLARAIVAHPALLLLDEPFNAVDVASRDRVRRTVIDHIVASGSRCVIATHDEADTDAADAVVVDLG
jgi:ABC-type taurine transport system ATPase subunit